MSTPELKAVEDQIAAHKAAIAIGQSLGRLMRNADFRKVILDGYLRDEAVKLVHGRMGALLQHPQMAEFQLKALDAISIFNQYLSQLKTNAEQALAQLPEAEQTREEIASESDD